MDITRPRAAGVRARLRSPYRRFFPVNQFRRHTAAVAVVIDRPVGSDAEGPRRLHRINVGPQEEEFPAVLLLPESDHFFDLPGDNYSRKICAIGLPLASSSTSLSRYPRLLILDEPTNGLDPAGIQEMRELICDLPGRFGMTVVVSSHLLSEIDQMADHVAIIREGELVFQDTLEVLHSRSRHHLALRTTNNAVARNLLAEKSVSCREEEGYLILPILSDEAAARLTRFLAEGRLGVVRLEERQKSLEDIFLELTGKAASL